MKIYQRKRDLLTSYCPFCNFKWDWKVWVINHIIQKHKDEWKKIKQQEELDLQEIKKVGYLYCPYCQQKFNQLTHTHFVTKHWKSKEQVLIEFPWLILYTGNKEIPTCSICNKPFISSILLWEHNKSIHNSLWQESKKWNFCCSICWKETNQIKSHIELKHLLSWDEYCSWFWMNREEKSFFSDTHKRSLSENKVIYYNETEEGIERREKQSKFFTENNPWKLKKTREQNSYNKVFNSEHSFYNYSYWLRIKIHNWEELKYHFRSFTEFIVYIYLLDNNIDFLYEEEKVEYVDKEWVIRFYLVDFLINEEIYEIKSNIESLTIEEKERYRQIENTSFRKVNIVTPEMIAKKFNFQIKTQSYFIWKLSTLLESNKLNSVKQYLREGTSSSLLSWLLKNEKIRNQILLT